MNWLGFGTLVRFDWTDLVPCVRLTQAPPKQVSHSQEKSCLSLAPLHVGRSTFCYCQDVIEKIRHRLSSWKKNDWRALDSYQTCSFHNSHSNLICNVSSHPRKGQKGFLQTFKWIWEEKKLGILGPTNQPHGGMAESARTTGIGKRAK